MTSVSDAVRGHVAAGALEPDAGQMDAAARLDALVAGLARSRGLFGRGAPPRGVWLHGPVGTGKSMLADMTFALAPVPKRRTHFHDFMAEAHGWIARWRALDARGRRRELGAAAKGDDPIPPLGAAIARDARLLVLDEAEITDIADAMLVGRLFERLLEQGVAPLVTSNRAPEELYQNGINRQLFLPFIALIRARLDVVGVDRGRDYRRQALAGEDLWLAPIEEATRTRFEQLWRRMTAGAGEHGETLHVAGRDVAIARAAAGCCRFTFDALCGSALGAADYLAMARRYRAVFLEDITAMAGEERDKARRFVTLVDALYEADCALAALAETEPEQLYVEGDYAFEFRRAASRIAQMRRRGAQL